MKTLRFTSMLFFLTAVAVAASEMRTDIEYAVAGNESLKLDVCIPDGDGPFPTAILVHGGAWRGGNKQVFITPIFQPLTDAGFVWFSIDYRLAPAHRYPAAVNDVTTAVRWIKAHAREYKADEKRMALIGESASGHLVALVGARDGRRLGIAAVAPFYPPCDMEAMTLGGDKTAPAFRAIGDFLGFTEPDERTRRLLRESSPITYVNKDMPPFLLIHGDKDQLVPYDQSVKMRDRMKQAGVSCDLYAVEGGGHGMNAWEKDPKL
ncbi:alpha/beta hydrolase, partial [Candidatus Sumerlaeota bacterium]|nr:alpha/beta hydrolase [Candidatus Sumerlaeota bacterium]